MNSRPSQRNLLALFAVFAFLVTVGALAAFVNTVSANASVNLPIQSKPAEGGTPSPTPTACARTWFVPDSPNSGHWNELIGVAATSSNDIWAVGDTFTTTITATMQYPLIEHWDGSSWTAIAPVEVLTGTRLYDVAAIAENDAWAVGTTFTNSISRALILHWDGSQWQRYSNPGEADQYSLTGISALSANDIWAVGGKRAPNQALAMHWDGTTWTIVAAPGLSVLQRVSAFSTNDVWAAGAGGNGTAMMHWNGTAWSASPDTFPGTPYGIKAISSSDVWVVSMEYSGNPWHSYTLHWNGTQWSLVSTDDGKKLLSITASSANDVWAVGSDGVGTFVKHWDGTTWTIVPTPNPNPPQGIFLNAVAISANEMWAVGRQNHDDLTLTARYAAECPTATPTDVPATPTAIPPTSTSTRTATNTAVSTSTPSRTASVINSATPIATSTTDLTSTATATSTATDIPPTFTTTFTPLPTQTMGGFTATSTGVPLTSTRTATNTAVPVSTVTQTAIATNSATPNATGTPVPTSTATATATNVPPTNINTSTPLPTQTMVNSTVTPPATPTSCPVLFTDVPVGSTFYSYVQCLACRGIVSGYTSDPPCTTGTPCFLPGANVTRGQMAKFISNAANYQDVIPANQQTFTDVPNSSPFWLYVERVYLHNIVSGYTTAPPCVTGTPCFLPGNSVTRGQAGKFVSNAANYQEGIPASQQTFTDVPNASPFWLYIERVYQHGIIDGYTSNPPCVTGTPCFLPGNSVTRGQTAKLITNAFFPGCQAQESGT